MSFGVQYVNQYQFWCTVCESVSVLVYSHWIMRVESSHSPPTGTRWYHTVIPLVPDGTTLQSHWYQMAPQCPPLVPDCTTLSSHWYQMALHCPPTGTRWHNTVPPLVPDGTTLSSHWYQMAPHCPPTAIRWHHTVLPLVPDGTTLSSHWY